MPLAKLAEGTRGWDLLNAVLGKNPITGEPVPRNAETLIGGFMKLIGQQEIWENIKRANAIARAWAWFQSALTGLLGFVTQIPTLFITAFKSLDLSDSSSCRGRSRRSPRVFGDFVGNFISLGGNAIWNLLEIIFDVVARGAGLHQAHRRGAFKEHPAQPVAIHRQSGQGGQARLPELRRQLPRAPQDRADRLAHRLAAGRLHPQGLHSRRDRQVRLLSARHLVAERTREAGQGHRRDRRSRRSETTFDIVVKLVTRGAGRGLGARSRSRCRHSRTW